MSTIPMEPNGGNFYHPHLLQIDSGNIWPIYPQHVPAFTGDWRDSLVTRPGGAL